MAIDFKKAIKTEDVPEIWQKFYEFRQVYSPQQFFNVYKFQPSLKWLVLPNGDVVPIGVNEYHYHVIHKLLERCGIDEYELSSGIKDRFSLKNGTQTLEDLFYENDVPTNWFTNSQGVIVSASGGGNMATTKLPCEYYYGKRLTAEQENTINYFIDNRVMEIEDYLNAQKKLEEIKCKFEKICVFCQTQNEEDYLGK